MNQGPPEEPLSGTLIDSLRNLAGALRSLSTALALAGIVSLVLGIVLLIFIPDLSLYSYIIMGVGGFSLLISVALSYRAVSGAMTGRRGRYTVNTTIMIVAFVGIAAVGNYLAFENSSRVDVTASKQFSLAPRTVDILKSLKEPVEAKAFFGPPQSPAEEAFQGQIDDLLHEFEVRSDKFSYEFIDPGLEPGIATNYGINPTTGYGKTALRSTDSKKTHLVSPSPFLEQDFVTGLLIVSGQEQKRVYFLTGHGEREIQDFSPDSGGFGRAHDGILGENYSVSTINLSLSDGEDTLARDREQNRVNMLIVAGPRNDLLEGESQILDDYLKNGGNMLFLLEPGTPQRFRDFLARWGIVVEEGHIVDAQRSVSGRNEIIALDQDQYFKFLPEPFNAFLRIQELTALDTTYYPGATSLKPAEGVAFYPTIEENEENEEEDDPAYILGTALGLTSGASWLIKDPTRNEPQEGDEQGIFFPAVALKAFAPLDEEPPADLSTVNAASLIVFGDSDFATNRYFYTLSNSDFFLNSVNWLVGDTALISIRPKPIAFRALVLTRNEFNVVRYTSWFLLPTIMALVGGFVWWKRR